MELRFTKYRSDPRRVLPVALGTLPSWIVSEYPLAPVAVETDQIVIAMTGIPGEELLEEIRVICQREVMVVVVSSDALHFARIRYLFGD